MTPPVSVPPKPIFPHLNAGLSFSGALATECTPETCNRELKWNQWGVSTHTFFKFFPSNKFKISPLLGTDLGYSSISGGQDLSGSNMHTLTFSLIAGADWSDFFRLGKVTFCSHLLLGIGLATAWGNSLVGPTAYAGPTSGSGVNLQGKLNLVGVDFPPFWSMSTSLLLFFTANYTHISGAKTADLSNPTHNVDYETWAAGLNATLEFNDVINHKKAKVKTDDGCTILVNMNIQEINEEADGLPAHRNLLKDAIASFNTTWSKLTPNQKSSFIEIERKNYRVRLADAKGVGEEQKDQDSYNGISSTDPKKEEKIRSIITRRYPNHYAPADSFKVLESDKAKFGGSPITDRTSLNNLPVGCNRADNLSREDVLTGIRHEKKAIETILENIRRANDTISHLSAVYPPASSVEEVAGSPAQKNSGGGQGVIVFRPGTLHLISDGYELLDLYATLLKGEEAPGILTDIDKQRRLMTSHIVIRGYRSMNESEVMASYRALYIKQMLESRGIRSERIHVEAYSVSSDMKLDRTGKRVKKDAADYMLDAQVVIKLIDATAAYSTPTDKTIAAGLSIPARMMESARSGQKRKSKSPEDLKNEADKLITDYRNYYRAYNKNKRDFPLSKLRQKFERATKAVNDYNATKPSAILSVSPSLPITTQ